jgi:hypothetical protein
MDEVYFHFVNRYWNTGECNSFELLILYHQPSILRCLFFDTNRQSGRC